MKILLTTLNAKYIHSNLALKYLFAVAGEERKSLELKEFTINHEDDYIYTELIRVEYGVICFSCYIWNIERTLYLAETLKRARPDLIIVLGGPEVTYQAEDILRKNEAIDFILTGEGEETFPQLLKLLINPDSSLHFSEINGLLYRKDDEIYGESATNTVDFQQVPFPYRNIEIEGDKILYYESSRGCPFQCSYCLSSIVKGVRSLPVDRVKKDLDYFILKKVKQVKFVDRTFNYDMNRSIEIFTYLIERDNGITNFHFELCGELIDEKMLMLLEKARPGLFQFEIGIQSTNDATLKTINRKTNLLILFKNIQKILNMDNIHIHLDLIAGLPYEDYNSFKCSFNEVYCLKPHQLQLGFLKLLPGTLIREQADKYDYIYRKKAPYEVISNRFISAEGFVRLKMVETVFNRYYNKGGFSQTLDFTTTKLGMEAFEFYEELARFYYLKGFQDRSHKKEDFYRILHLYGMWKDKFFPGVGKKMEQVLLLDINQSMNPEIAKNMMKKGWWTGDE